MDTRRLALLMIFSFSLVMLWDSWQRQSLPKAPIQGAAQGAPAGVTAGVPAASGSSTAPTGSVPVASKPVGATLAAVPGSPAKLDAGAKAIVKTDLLVAQISSVGGDLVHLELNKHRDGLDKTKGFVLFDSGVKHVYLGQSGLIGEGLPNHKSVWSLKEGEHILKDGEKELRLKLEATGANGAKISKTYVFQRDSYEIELIQEGAPAGSQAYYQITRDGKPTDGSQGGMMGITTFTGPAVYTATEKFQKVEFSDLEKGKAKFSTKADNGWIALVQHYFVSAWLLPEKLEREYFMRGVGDNLYSAGVIAPVGADGKSSVRLYSGPQEQSKLEKIAPGLELVVDYGWLTMVAAPLFWVLELIHRLTGNWGWAIIGLTVLIKGVFFPLSAASYKSMAKMKVLTPKLMKLKETYGDDKQRLNQEMMELYKREKVNPLGGCLPILIQIPVFIALYWVLLGAVEMRNAPWLGWITDLSVQDPYYVLPLIMGVSMFVQTKLNPTPPDPIQAKIMLWMPVLFTGLFLFFPAGLVLYWVVNNVLSIAQQWQINRMIETGEGKK
jgi:YidC/Oxa1 family membrane protein insertase